MKRRRRRNDERLKSSARVGQLVWAKTEAKCCGKGQTAVRNINRDRRSARARVRARALRREDAVRRAERGERGRKPGVRSKPLAREQGHKGEQRADVRMRVE